MVDKSTVGITAEPEEVEAALRNLCGYHLSERDPLLRYAALTREQVLYDALVAAIKRERGRALAELAATGQKLTQIAQMTNLTSRQQVQRLIALARTAELAAANVAAAEVQAASREFDDRLAAVEATLDEVVSGISPPVSPAAMPTEAAEPEAQPYAGAVGGLWYPAPAGAGSAGEDPDPYGWSTEDHAPVYAPQAEEVPADGASVFLEPTQFMPALRGVLHPTKEMPKPSDEVPWWRRGRDSREAKDPGAA